MHKFLVILFVITGCLNQCLQISNLCFLIPVAITQIFNPIDELVIPTEIATKEAKSEMETVPVSAKTKISKSSI